MQNNTEFPFIKSIYELLGKLDNIDKDDIIGCTENEINILEELHPFGIKLPMAYKEFLKHFGKKILNMQPTSHFFYNEIKRAWTDPLICLRLYNKDFFYKKFTPLSDPKLLFPTNAFAFSIHEGYQFRFFFCGEEEDPLTYFIEYNPKGKSFEKDILYSDLMIEYVKNFIRIHETLLNNKPDKKKHFFTFKKMFNELLVDLEILSLKRNLITDFDDTYDLYHSIDIYEFFNDQSIFLGAYYGLTSSDSETKNLIDNFMAKGRKIEYFYREFLK